MDDQVRNAPRAPLQYQESDPEATVYLKPNVKLEPLVCRWSAWPHLLSPATLAMNIAFRYLTNLKSFVANPAVHVAAARDPALLGGPFVALAAADVPRVRELIKSTTEECRELLELAVELRTLDAKLQSEANGFSLDEHYKRVGRHLLGRIELAYDLNQRAHLRLFEEEELYRGSQMRGAQEICLHTEPDADRHFFMSTPMLERPDRVFLDLGFDDPRVEELSALRTRGAIRSGICERLGLQGQAKAAFEEMLTVDPPVRLSPDYAGEGVRLRHFGHACVLIQTSEVSVLIDPLTAWERNTTDATLTFGDLPDVIDYAVISHCHQDHFIPEMLLQLRGRIRKVIVPRNDRGSLADPSMKLILRRLGYSDIAVVDPFDSVSVPGGAIFSLPFTGEHAGLDIASKQCIAIKVKGRSFAFLIDSDCIHSALYRQLPALVGHLDALFIGMECRGAPLSWLYGPLIAVPVSRRNDESRRLSASDCERAWGLVQEIPCSRAYVYAMGQESWLKGLMGLAYAPDSVQIVESNRFIELCRSAGIHSKRLLGSGEILF